MRRTKGIARKSRRTRHTAASPGVPAAAGALLALALCLGIGSFARAQTGGATDLRWNSFDGGGTTAISGGNLELGGTIGQPDAAGMSGGSLVLAGGFWQAVGTLSAVGPFTNPPRPPDLPLVFRFHTPAPNPARGSVELTFDLPEARAVELGVFDLRGIQVGEVPRRQFAAGSQRLLWNGLDPFGRPVATGVYYLRLAAGAESARQKVVLLR